MSVDPGTTVREVIADVSEDFEDDGGSREAIHRPTMRGYGRERLDLPPTVVDHILASDYARLVARRRSVRRALFPQIVSLHSKRDLARIEGLNAVTIRKIEIWLIQHGTRLRRSRESIDVVICNFRPRRLLRLGSLARASRSAHLEAAE